MGSELRSSAMLGVAGLLSLYLVQSSWLWISDANTPEALLYDVEPSDFMLQQSKPYAEKQVIQVTKDVYVAVGFSMVNSIMLEGPDGLVVVDTTMNLDIAKDILKEFRNISNKPIKAIIYTHYHADHTYGAEAFIEDPENPPDIWAHEEFLRQMKLSAITGQLGFKRATRQFGFFLPESVNRKSGINLMFDKTLKSTTVFPTKLVKGKQMTLDVAGITLELFHLPGETDDHLNVYWPERGVMCPGDNIYKAFPNLYAVRGTPNRDLMKWVASLDAIMELDPDYLVPSHTFPISGKQNITETLTVYRDAIQYVHDQTVRYMNKGMHPNDIVPLVQLPPHMADHPYLLPLYGTVPWSVRGVFETYMGWFSGDIADLAPMSTSDKAEKMVALAGGRKNILKKAQRAFDKGDTQWALELSTHAFRLNNNDESARMIRTACMKKLASEQTSSNGRQYYLVQAVEDYEQSSVKLNPKRMIERMPMAMLLEMLTVKVKAEECHHMDRVAVFEFTDTAEQYTIHLRNGIMVVMDTVPDKWDVKLTTTSVTWRAVLAKDKSPLSAYATGEMTFDGGALSFREFMDCIEKD